MVYFEISSLGNRVVFKTRRNGEVTKVTHMKENEAIKTINNIKAHGWNIVKIRNLNDFNEINELI